MSLHPTTGPGGLFALAVHGAQADSVLSDAAAALWCAAGLEATSLYLGVWSSAAFHVKEYGDGQFIVGPAVFCPSLGYDEADLAEIHRLAVGDTWTGRAYGPFHSIRRIR